MTKAHLGHASIQTTLDRYGHLMPEMSEAEARKLDKLVFGDRSASADTSRDDDSNAVRRGQNGDNNEKGASGADR